MTELTLPIQRHDLILNSQNLKKNFDLSLTNTHQSLTDRNLLPITKRDNLCFSLRIITRKRKKEPL